jgi:hAT family C-terminal dimerisation region
MKLHLLLSCTCCCHEVAYIVVSDRLPFRVLRLVDGATPVMGKVYHCGLLIQTQLEKGIQGLTLGQLYSVKALWDERWEQLHSPLHAAGIALDPEFRRHAAVGDHEVVSGLHEVIDLMLPDADERVMALIQYDAYIKGTGVWARETVWAAAAKMPAHVWWATYGTSCKQLSLVAQRVLSQVSSACSCERNWSTYKFVHSKLRNRLAPKRAESLVYVFSNLRQLEASGSIGAAAKFIPWGYPVLDDVAIADELVCEGEEEDAELWEADEEGGLGSDDDTGSDDDDQSDD